MKNLFVVGAIVMATVAFSACDSKPAAESTEPTETEAVESVEDTAVLAPTDTTAMTHDTAAAK